MHGTEKMTDSLQGKDHAPAFRMPWNCFHMLVEIELGKVRRKNESVGWKRKKGRQSPH